MAGLSSRFFKAGYHEPKYKLEILAESVFAHATKSFSRYFDTDLFVFVIRDVFNTKFFVQSEIARLGIKNFKIVTINYETRGQAETAYLGLKEINSNESVTIFNIDTLRYDYKKPEELDSWDGYLEVFEAEGEHWSFVEPGYKNRVIRTTEKDRISNLCSDGLYYFKTKELFMKTFETASRNEELVRGEFYVAPLYNKLISDSLDIRYDIINLDQIDFCGTPDEYESLAKKMTSGNK